MMLLNLLLLNLSISADLRDLQEIWLKADASEIPRLQERIRDLEQEKEALLNYHPGAIERLRADHRAYESELRSHNREAEKCWSEEMHAAKEKIASLEREKQEVEDEALARNLQAEINPSAPSSPSSTGVGFTVCGVCLERAADHVYNSCGHVTCASCFESRQSQQCPYCRKTHFGIIPIRHVLDEEAAPASPSVTSTPPGFSSTQPLPQSAPMPPPHMMMPTPHMMMLPPYMVYEENRFVGTQPLPQSAPMPPPHMMMMVQMMMGSQPMQQPQEPQRERRGPAVNRRRANRANADEDWSGLGRRRNFQLQGERDS